MYSYTRQPAAVLRARAHQVHHVGVPNVIQQLDLIDDDGDTTTNRVITAFCKNNGTD